MGAEDSNFPFAFAEKRWQEEWQKADSFSFSVTDNRESYYVLEMFPYPSGNIHMGHLRNYTIGDVIARFYRAKGYNVLHPMGWDSFGLPAENAAIERNIHPRSWTRDNIEKMRDQLKMLGLSYDWHREISTCEPEYFKHEQKIFLDFLKNDIAYQKETYVNWDPVDQTVLANEQVIEGRGWRSGALIEKKKLKGWFLRVSDFAQDLLDDMPSDDDWPASVTNMQTKWIGKSVGAEINFAIQDSDESLLIYTTRPETLFGASFCAIAAEHPLALKLQDTNPEIKEFVKKYCANTLAQEDIDKAEKHGIDTGLKIVHPFNPDQVLPLYIANFVLMDYGTGAVFACPAHDERDFAFAKKYNLPIKQVVAEANAEQSQLTEAYLGSGSMINSDFLNGLQVTDAKEQAIKEIVSRKIGVAKTNFRIRDWGVSRQRYWGCPIPIINCADCGAVPVAEADLPVTLPDEVEFTGKGNPLAANLAWQQTKCPKCGKDALRETDTFDTFFESSWYFFRYLDSQNDKIAFKSEDVAKLLPVNQYIGGIEHAVLHLLYARFFTKALAKCGYHNISEPFAKLLTQGMVTNHIYKDKSGSFAEYEQVVYDKTEKKYINLETKEEVIKGRLEKMSKSKKNGVSPISIISTYGADTARLFMMSDSPPEKDLIWSEAGLDGAWRYQNKLWRFVNANLANLPETNDFVETELTAKEKELHSFLHKTIKIITSDIIEFKFNRAVAKIRELSNFFMEVEFNNFAFLRFILSEFVKLINPFTPHLAEEIWSKLGNKNLLVNEKWPNYDEKYLQDDMSKIAVQINGKMKALFEISVSASREEYENVVLNLPIVQKNINGKEIRKLIIIPNKIVNVVL